MIAPLIAGALVVLAAPAAAQTPHGMAMPDGHAHHPAPAEPAPAPHRHPPAPVAPAVAPTQHRHAHHPATDTGPMDHPAMDHATMAHPPSEPDVPAGTALPAGNALAPAPPTDHYADRTYGAAAMAESRAALRSDHGGGVFSQVTVNLAEVRAHRGRDGYRWDGEAWLGGDIHRLTLKSEGEGAFGRRPEAAEVQALYSRAIDPYWNLQAGVRYDLRPDPSRAYAVLGVEGLAPYWFDVEAALFVSDKGDVLARVEGYHDLRVTQRWILQPRAELNLAAQDMPAQGIGSGLSSAELGLRLRYEIRRTVAPYVGLSWERKLGETARFARAEGERASAISLVLGIRSWF
ncbi:copper resistance protein B [Sphingomonas sp. ac-8]|uniref:copper resistance protein B n=1 Tax=Sphingomonas sp. ac-8 TaxID=3242977 RepID=UPI003A7FA4F6